MPKHGELIRAVREQKKLSLRAVYEATGISDSIQSRIENDDERTGLSLEMAQKLSEVFGMSLFDFLIKTKYITEEDLSSHQLLTESTSQFNESDMKYLQETVKYIIASHSNERSIDT